MSSAVQRIILHMDMDAFFAAIEQRDDPSLRGKALLVGGPKRRGVVSTASYEARPFGVGSAMPMTQALRLCPHAIVRPPRLAHYAEVSGQIMQVLDTFTPYVEALSLDEAFMDMSGSQRLFGEPNEMARSVKEAIFEATALTCSVGIAANKFLAKLASDLDKPDGITWIPFDDSASFIAPLSIRKLWGVGPRSAERLQQLGLETIGDVANAEQCFLEQALGLAQAQHLQALANGQDERPVISDRGRKSVGSEVTLSEDVRGRAQVEKVLRQQCQRVARHLRKSGLLAGGVRVKVRYSRNFKLASRQQRLERPCDDSRSLIDATFSLLERLDLDQPIRLGGAAAFDLESAEKPGQLGLFEKAARSQSKLEHTMDEIRDRYGDKINFGK